MSLLGKLNFLGSGRKARGRSSLGQRENRRILGYAAGIVLAILIMFVLFNYETVQSDYGKAYSAIANEQQVVSQQIATYALESSIGNSAAFIQLRRFRDRFAGTLEQLRMGDPTQGLPPLPFDLRGDREIIESAWTDYSFSIQLILDARESIETVSSFVTQINESIPELLVLSEDVVQILIKKEAARTDIAQASRQLALIQSVQNSLNQIMGGGDAVMAAADQFGRETVMIERILIGMLEGDRELGINKLSGEEVLAKLLQLADLFSVVKKNVNQILQNSPQLFEVRDAASDIQVISPRLLGASRDLVKNIALYDDRLRLFTVLAYVAGAVALVLLILMGLQLVKASNRQLLESKEQNERNQRAILRLLDEMSNLADGDLSTHTTVTEDITGAIADSVNYSVDALRDLISTINATAAQVSTAVENTQATTAELTQASESQAEKIESVSAAITTISDSMNSMSGDAADSADAAKNSVNIAHSGGETVRKTIAGMESIREQIQETSKRIKRLGESSQEIGDIVNLITEISDQTNILALNAAIQASMAGEAGRGFAVVADEVQRLAERTGDATKQIEALVRTIQADTSEAISSMEQSTSNVVEGANLAENAGGALEEIETVSTSLAERIQAISDATREHAGDSVEIARSMDEIQQITLITSQGTEQTARSIGELSSLVQDLHNSVAGFTLPDDHHEDIGDSTLISNVHDLSEVKIEPTQS
jgi:twitching motility protein PilJ